MMDFIWLWYVGVHMTITWGLRTVVSNHTDIPKLHVFHIYFLDSNHMNLVRDTCHGNGLAMHENVVLFCINMLC